MRKALTYILLLLMPVIAVAQDYGTELSDASGRLSVLKSANAMIETIDADFVAHKKSAMLTDIQKSVGEMSYRRNDDYLSLHYTEPLGNDIIISGSNITMTSAGKSNTMSAKQNPAVSQMIMMIKACVTGDFASLSDKSEVKYFQTSDLFTIVINPKNARVKRYIKQIVLRYNNDNSLGFMKMDEGSGNYSEYIYSNQIITKK